MGKRIVHQDYGWSNGQMGEGGIWIIDLDGVAYDLPIRDLRKLITSTMDDMGVWDVTWMKGMIQAYHQAHPIEPELFQILLIDMSLPNEFYKNVKANASKMILPVHLTQYHGGEGVRLRVRTDLRPCLYGRASGNRLFAGRSKGAA